MRKLAAAHPTISGGTAPFRKRDFEVSVEIDQLDTPLVVEFADSICRARTSQLGNIIEIEVCHRPGRQIPRVVQEIIFNGVRRLSLKTKDPVESDNDPRAYLEFVYENGKVVNEHTEMSRRSRGDDELMVDVIRISFDKKTFTACMRV